MNDHVLVIEGLQVAVYRQIRLRVAGRSAPGLLTGRAAGPGPASVVGDDDPVPVPVVVPVELPAGVLDVVEPVDVVELDGVVDVVPDGDWLVPTVVVLVDDWVPSAVSVELSVGVRGRVGTVGGRATAAARHRRAPGGLRGAAWWGS